jgi:crotonobetainyl-CoA:carnitine CoA-transferase CaiB-like acyl-CoA transferase
MRMQQPPSRSGPLAGIRVIDVTSVVLGPTATQILGDLGADVIKIEPREGDSLRHIGPRADRAMGSYFGALNRNKRSIVLDLKRPAAQETVLRLVGTADVFVHNMRQGAAARLGLDYASLKARNPGLIYASASGFRQDSSARDDPAFDDLIQGLSGAAFLNAAEDGVPRYFPTVLVDKLTGQMMAAMIGMALFHRARTGEGQEVHVPMMETMVSFLLIEHLWAGVYGEPEKGLGYPRMLTPHRRPYATKDGYISVIALTNAHWRNLFAAMGRPELIEDPRFGSIAARSEHVDAVYATLTEGMKQRTTAEWLEVLRAADIPCGRTNSLVDLLTDPYLRETGFLREAEHPTEGKAILTAFAPSFSATPASVRRLWPTLGEHTAEVLREAGLSDSEIAAATGDTASGG